MQLTVQPEEIQNKIYLVRNQKIMLDTDLAILFEVTNKVLNQNARRNLNRFPNDFRFQITETEFANLKSQFPYLKKGRFLPYCFTEHGVSMLASILNSDRAIDIHLLIIRAFVHLRNSSRHDPSFEPRLAFLEREFRKLSETQKLEYRTEHFQTTPSTDGIQIAVAQYFNLSVKSILKPTREHRIVQTRAIAMYLMRKHLKISLKEIGAQFGGKDHTTVLHACRRIEEALATDQGLRKTLEEIEGALNKH